MKKMWLIFSCALIIIASVLGPSIPLRIALALDAALIVTDIIVTVRRGYNGREEKN